MGGRCQGAAPGAEGQAPDAGAQTVEWCSRRGTGWPPPLSSSLLLSLLSSPAVCPRPHLPWCVGTQTQPLTQGHNPAPPLPPPPHPLPAPPPPPPVAWGGCTRRTAPRGWRGTRPWVVRGAGLAGLGQGNGQVKGWGVARGGGHCSCTAIMHLAVALSLSSPLAPSPCTPRWGRGRGRQGGRCIALGQWEQWRLTPRPTVYQLRWPGR